MFYVERNKYAEFTLREAEYDLIFQETNFLKAHVIEAVIMRG